MKLLDVTKPAAVAAIALLAFGAGATVTALTVAGAQGAPHHTEAQSRPPVNATGRMGPAGSQVRGLANLSRGYPARERSLRRDLQQPGVDVPLGLPPYCAFQPFTAPDSTQMAATISSPPSGLSASTSVEYVTSTLPPGQAANAGPYGYTFRIMSVTEYTGTTGTVYISLIVPSPAAIAAGVNLDVGGGDSPVGYLPDGTPLHAEGVSASMPPGCSGAGPSSKVSWMRNGMVIQLLSPDLSTSQLEALASSVAVS